MNSRMLSSILNLLCIFLTLFGLGIEATVAQSPEYASFSGGLSGTGTFSCDEMPDFTYSITGEYAQGDTKVPGDPQVIDNDGGGMEVVYGKADSLQNIEVEVAGYGAGNDDGVGDTITASVVTTIVFDAKTPPGDLAFMIADVEQDQVMITALDAFENSVPVSVIDTWYQSSFDADLSDTSTESPSWDSASATLVGQYAVGGVKQTNYLTERLDNEAGAAWFEVNIAITQLQFISQAFGVTPDDPSQHFLIAAKCQEPVCANLFNNSAICEYIIANPDSSIAQEDCDGGGISNLNECLSGDDPINPSDDCPSVGCANINIRQ